MASSSQAELASVALEKPVETADPSRSSTVDVETSAPPQSADPPAKSEEPIAARKSKKKSKSKRKKISTAHLTVIQQQMEDLASQLRQAEEARTKVEAGEKITEQEQVSIDKRSATSAALEQLQALYAKLSSPDMLGDTASKKKEEDKKVASTSKRSPEYEQQRSLTLLHFFYIVRLAQQGFFTIISSVYPRLEPLAIVHLCDKLVGGSLFAAKDLSEEVRLSKRKEVFSLLRKLNDGVDEPIDEGFVTTFREIREIIHHLIDNSLDASSDPQRAGWTQRMPTPQSSTPSSQPLLVVVPYNSMIDTSLLPIQAPYASAYVNSGAFSDYYGKVKIPHKIMQQKRARC
ncbi:uncharacterized protein BYT42DRAFT_259616 [Radiomyces spectabilis]|uniref:uncharacterized protein n=1 Tax=Radiomyces spectabilis TaxID=64574 RepID=UPI00221EFCB5|nr:uncharacterized protein BYT42DRAFT_259616 [Radiomyces spectabilis]KAI8384402.1 hypothetical protein BYT42DRAFT_259616 [Radiomyces spectabilis]